MYGNNIMSIERYESCINAFIFFDFLPNSHKRLNTKIYIPFFLTKLLKFYYVHCIISFYALVPISFSSFDVFFLLCCLRFLFYFFSVSIFLLLLLDNKIFFTVPFPLLLNREEKKMFLCDLNFN